MNTHTRPTTIRRLLTCAALIGACAGAAAGVPTIATAGPDSHNSPADNGDQSGWNHIDPQGFHHTDSDPRAQSQRDDARRDYFNNHQSQPAARVGGSGGSGGNTRSWNRVRQPDGSGWAVCPERASWC